MLYYDFFFFNDTATTEIYTLSLHDALPTSRMSSSLNPRIVTAGVPMRTPEAIVGGRSSRSEEHTSELQSHVNLVCRLLLEKKNKTELTAHAHHAGYTLTLH